MLTFDSEYKDIELHQCVELVVRAKAQQPQQRPSDYGMSQFGLPLARDNASNPPQPGPYLMYPTPSGPPNQMGPRPAYPNATSSMDGNSLQALLGNLHNRPYSNSQPQQQYPPPGQQQQGPYMHQPSFSPPAGTQPQRNDLASIFGGGQQPNQSGFQQPPPYGQPQQSPQQGQSPFQNFNANNAPNNMFGGGNAQRPGATPGGNQPSHYMGQYNQQFPNQRPQQSPFPPSQQSTPAGANFGGYQQGYQGPGQQSNQDMQNVLTNLANYGR